MKIGVDARFLTHPQEGGFKTYTECLVPALQVVDRQNEYVLYTDRESRDGLPESDNFRVRVVQGSLPVREQVAMPIALARDRVDVAHFLCNTAPLFARCSTVLTIHDVIPCLPSATPDPQAGPKQRLLERYWREVIPLSAARASRIITDSLASSEDIQRVLGISPDRISVVHLGIDRAFGELEQTELDAVLGEYNLRGKRFLLGFVSKDARKNVSGLIEAHKLVAERVPDCGLVLVSSSREVIGSLPEETIRDPRASILCGLSRAHLVGVYNAAAALVFPSFAEGFGMPLLEAMACGTPVVASDIMAHREVAGDAALLVDPHVTKAIADAAAAVLSDENLSRRLRTLGLRRAEQFSWEENARQVVSVYSQAAGGREVAEDSGPGETET